MQPKTGTMIKTIRAVLTENENILYDARIHWMVFGAPIFYGLCGLLAWLFFDPILGGVILLMNIYPVYYSVVAFITTHLILTNKKVIGRTGFLTRDWRQVTLERIETAYLEEPIIGRLLGYSSVIVRGTGTGSIAFRFVVDGEVFIKKLESMMAYTREKEAA